MKEYFSSDSGKSLVGALLMVASIWMPFGTIFWFAGAAIFLYYNRNYIVDFVKNTTEKAKGIVRNLFSRFKKSPVEVESED